MKNIRWVIAHEPIDLFLRAAEQFAAEIKESTNGEIGIEILSLTDYADKYHGGKKITKHDLLDLMEAGEVEMSQMYTTTLGKYSFDLFALDLPYLFTSHEHATRVLDGEVGAELLDSLTEDSPFKALAFTYSGGYRCIPANSKIESADDFKGMRIRTSKSPVAQAFFKSLGATPVDVELEEMNDAADEGIIDAGESTHVRVFPLEQDKHFAFINDTAHSLFLTSIIATQKFWFSLTPDQKAAVQAAARTAATNERVEAVKVVEEVRARLGDRLVSMPADKVDALRLRALLATRGFHWNFSDNFVAKIDALRDNT